MTASVNSPNGAYARPSYPPGRPPHKHGYIYGSGMVGCLYDNGPHWAKSLEDAIESLVQDFDDVPGLDLVEFAEELRGGYAALPHGAGADYAEITEATAEQAAQFQERSHEILT